MLDVPGSIDLAVIVIPYAMVPEALRTCGEKGIPAAVVISAGFREAGSEGLERELELIQIARQYNLRLIGPNCLGVIDTYTPLNASFAAGTPPSGPMAFMSQSGALGTAVLDIALAGRLGLSKFVSLGNKADVSEIDLLEAWVEDPNTRVIMIYSEGMPNGQQFIQTARQVTTKNTSGGHKIWRYPIRLPCRLISHWLPGRIRAGLPGSFPPGRHLTGPVHAILV